MQSFGCSPLALLFPNPLVPLSILWWLYRAQQLRLVSLSLSFSIFLFFSLARSRYLSLFSLSFFYFFFFFFIFYFLLTISRFGRLAEIRWSVYISRSQRSLSVSFSRADSGLLYEFFHIFISLIFPNVFIKIFFFIILNLICNDYFHNWDVDGQ